MKRIARAAGLILADALIINISYMISYLLRFDFAIESTAFITSFEVYLTFWFLLTLIKLVIFAAFGLYRCLWRFAGAYDMLKVIAAVFASNLAAGIVYLFLNGEVQRSLVLLPFVFDLLLIGGVRMFYRFFGNCGIKINSKTELEGFKKVMIVGSGYAAAAVIKEMRIHSKDMKAIPVVAIDDNRNRVGNTISGVKIEGTRKDIPRLVRRYRVDEIFISLPSQNKKEIEAYMNECARTECRVKLLPAIHEFINGSVSVSRFMDLRPEELFKGEQPEINSKKLTDCFKGRIILVTGAGGTIGSEICRQIGDYLPRKIVALDASETGMFELELELKNKYPDIDILVSIGSVTDKDFMRQIFKENRPHIVIHAASYKNVQLMQENPAEAVKNNIFGTKALIEVCEEFAAEKLVYISSDKAIRQGGVLSAVTRICEMMIKERAEKSKTRYIAVRLSNILGSEGSVIPLFKKQIESGGPVTVTHPEATRYFLPLKPAILLILQTIAISQEGRIFSINYGKPLKVMEVAEYMIESAGLKPRDDIPIKIVGLRAGEKLYEDMLPESRYIAKTSNSHIVSVLGEEVEGEELFEGLEELKEKLRDGDSASLKQALDRIADYEAEPEEDGGEKTKYVEKTEKMKNTEKTEA